MGGFLPPAERRSSALLGLYAALSLLLLLTGDRIPTAALRGAGAWLFAPLDRVVLAADRMAGAWRESQHLTERLARLEVENLRLRGMAIENQQLREQLGHSAWRGVTLKPVEILALSGEPVPVAAVLSAGRQVGVREGDALVTSEGLVGRISEVYPTLSRAILITDLNSAVACEVESTGVLGVVHFVSSPRPRLVLTGVPMSDTVRVGESVVTSGLSRRYPRGLAVGTVTRVGRDPSGLTHDIQIEASARFSRLRYGFIVPGPAPLDGVKS